MGGGDPGPAPFSLCSAKLASPGVSPSRRLHSRAPKLTVCEIGQVYRAPALLQASSGSKERELASWGLPLSWRLASSSLLHSRVSVRPHSL